LPDQVLDEVSDISSDYKSKPGSRRRNRESREKMGSPNSKSKMKVDKKVNFTIDDGSESKDSNGEPQSKEIEVNFV